MANVHPETGKEIPRVFRMSSFVLVNIPIAIGLALTAPTVISFQKSWYLNFCSLSMSDSGKLLINLITSVSMSSMPMPLMLPLTILNSPVPLSLFIGKLISYFCRELWYCCFFCCYRQSWSSCPY